MPSLPVSGRKSTDLATVCQLEPCRTETRRGQLRVLNNAEPAHEPAARRPFSLAYREGWMYVHSVTEWEAQLSKPSDLVQGTLDLLILKILALEPLNGWAISQRLRQVSDHILQVSDGSLYPALHKLEQEGWISAEWKPSENNRRAKFYSLTRPGSRHLEKETANWNRLSGAISLVVQLPEA